MSFRRAPQSAVTELGGRVSFEAEAGGSPPLQYQWRHNGQNIPGATASTYVIEAVSLSDAGTCSVAVANVTGAITSEPASLLVTLPAAPPEDNFAQRAQLLPFDRGTLASTNRFATRESGEPLHADKPGQRSIWFDWRAPVGNAGRVRINTTGSAFDALMAVYQGVSRSRWMALRPEVDGVLRIEPVNRRFTVILSAYAHTKNEAAPLGCSVDGVLRFSVARNTYYALAIVAEGEELESVELDFQLGQPPPPPLPRLLSQTVMPGEEIVLDAGGALAPGPLPAYQWQRNGVTILGAVGVQHSIKPAGFEDEGSYSVIIDNLIGRVTNLVACLIVERPMLGLTGAVIEDGTFRVMVGGNPGQKFAMQYSVDLKSWEPNIDVGWISAEGHSPYFDQAVRRVPYQFYRAVLLPLQVERGGELAKRAKRMEGWRVTGGRLGQQFVVERSVDQANWTPIGTNEVRDVEWQFEAEPEPNILYRARVFEKPCELGR